MQEVIINVAHERVIQSQFTSINVSLANTVVCKAIVIKAA